MLARMVEQRLSFKVRETRVPGNNALAIGRAAQRFPGCTRTLRVGMRRGRGIEAGVSGGAFGEGCREDAGGDVVEVVDLGCGLAGKRPQNSSGVLDEVPSKEIGGVEDHRPAGRPVKPGDHPHRNAPGLPGGRAARRGVGSIPAACGICHTVEAAVEWPSLTNSPWTHRCPTSGCPPRYGQVIDVLLSTSRDLAATRLFFTRVLRAHTIPVEVTTDRAPAYPRVLDELLPSAPPACCNCGT
jgi:hypothetical protein